MPRKCSVGECRSNYENEEEHVNVHGFPINNPVELQRWREALLNILPTKITKNMAVCVKHWSPNYETYRKKGCDVPVNPPSIFSVPSSFLRQNTNTAPRNVEARNVDAESRRKGYEAQIQTANLDIIENWNSLEEYCAKLDIVMAKKDDRLILTDISVDPPKLTFSFTIFKDFKICCYKGLTKVAHTDLINGFTYKLETYFQIVDVLE